MVITDEIRAACAEVAEQARRVRIRAERIPAYAASLPPAEPLAAGTMLAGSERELAAAFWLTLDAVNFGSGWFPTLRKRSHPTGYRTVAAGIKRRFDESGPWTAAELERIESGELAALMDQDPAHELMALFAASLRDLGAHLNAQRGGSWLRLIDDSDGSAVALVETLSGWPSFADRCAYRDLSVPFLKRAQIAAADLSRAGAARFEDLDQLTLFADNLVPHVLRLDGVLEFDADLVGRIERGDLLIHGSEEEIEIRACAVQAVELIRAEAVALTAAELDQLLWNRGQGRAYKAVPRHRARCTAY